MWAAGGARCVGRRNRPESRSSDRPSVPLPHPRSIACRGASESRPLEPDRLGTLVAPTRFELAIFALRGRRPKPLAYGAIESTRLPPGAHLLKRAHPPSDAMAAKSWPPDRHVSSLNRGRMHRRGSDTGFRFRPVQLVWKGRRSRGRYPGERRCGLVPAEHPIPEDLNTGFSRASVCPPAEDAHPLQVARRGVVPRVVVPTGRIRGVARGVADREGDGVVGGGCGVVQGVHHRPLLYHAILRSRGP